MFRLESYITPIILNYVDKYVKNFRTQDAQISLFSGDVALQNLDLKLSVLEEDLSLPLKFISGHIHELCIHIPWVKLAFEPIVLSINTIEFVVQLKEPEAAEASGSGEKKKVDYEPPPGYVASLVTKIIHNVVIKCNNIILKFIEDDIVLSMNIQELVLSAADLNWNQSFIDISPIKFLVRKLMRITDLTVCLDRRNAIGKIEVILEPILYRCSLEARILTKYNFSTKQKTSLNRIDALIKTFDINLSTDQFPMLVRLAEVFRNLPEKNKIESETASLEDHHEGQEHYNDSLVSWLWNSMPAFFSEDNELEELEEAHIFHLGTYIQDVRVVFKSQELLNEASTTKKVKFNPVLSMEIGGVYTNLVNIGKSWSTSTAGISTMAVSFMGECPCRCPMTVQQVFTCVADISAEYIRGSLFDSDSVENAGLPTKYNTDWTVHVEQLDEQALLQKSGAFAVDVVRCTYASSALLSSSSFVAVNRKNLVRAFVGPFTFRYNSDFVHRVEKIKEFFGPSKIPDQIETKNLPPPTEEDVEYLLRGIHMQLFHLIVIRPCIEIHMWDHTNLPKRKPVRRTFLPRLVLAIDRIEANVQLPLESTLVPTISQLREIPTRLEDTPFNRCDLEIGSVEASLDFSGNQFPLMQLNEIAGDIKQLIQPHLWTDRIKTNIDLTVKSATLKMNPAQLYFTAYLLQSNAQKRPIDVLNTNLLANISNQHLVALELTWEKILFGFDESTDYRIVQMEIQKMDGHAVIPILKASTHVIEWPTLKGTKQPNFLSVIHQMPLHEAAISCPPIIDLRVEAGGIAVDSLMCRFLNYDVTRWSFPVYEGNQMSSKSDTAIVSTPVKRPTARTTIEPRVPPVIPSVQSSSDRDANTSMIVETDETSEDERGLSSMFQLAKHLVVQIDVGETTVYFPSKVMKCSVFNQTEVKRIGAFQDNDCLVLGIPGVTVISSVGQVEINSLVVPIKLAPRHWTHGKLSFPWNIQFTDAKLGTIQKESQFNFLQPNTMNIIISINDVDQLSVDLHIDMKPVLVNFMTDQMNFILKTLRHFLSLNLFKKFDKNRSSNIDFTSNESSKEIKEFLSYTQASSSYYSKVVKPRRSRGFKAETYALLLQFTLSKIEFVLHNCGPAKKCSKQFTVTFEDIIMTFNQRPNYYQFSLKIASGKGICMEKLELFNEFNKNENLGFHFRSHEGGEDDRNPSVVELLVTSADKQEVQSKWKVKLEPSLNSDNAQLTEVMLKVQRLDIIVDFDMLNHFIGIFRFDRKADDTTSDKLMSVADLPLLDFQSKGLKIFVPLSGVNKNCDVYILSIESMTMIDPDNKIDRKPLRPDIYHKALQLGILDIFGTKVENRQYELLFANISLCTGNWVGVLDSVFKQRLAIYHDNPAVEWNKKGSPLANRTELQEVSTIFKDFNLGIVYAPNIVFECALVCEEAIEFNCTNDVTIHMNLDQLVLAVQLLDSYETLMKIWHPTPDIFVYDSITSEYVGVSSDLFQTSPTRMRSTTQAERVMREINENPRPAEKPRGPPKYLEKRTMSLINFERKSDSGIESIGASNDKRQLKRRISKLKRHQSQITEVVLMPYEVYFNGGIFTFKLYATEVEVQKRHPDKELEAEQFPLLTLLIDRPNVFIRQTNHEKGLKVSITDLKLSLSEALRKKRQVQIAEVPILDTRSGESDHTGARKPLIELRQVKFLTKPEEIELLVQRPVKIALSHTKIKNLFDIEAKVMHPLQKKRNSRPQILQVLAKRKKIFYQVSNLIGGLRRFNISLAQLVFEFTDAEYDLKLLISRTELILGLVERIERVNFTVKVKNALLTSMGKTIVHPASFGAEVILTQESWKKEPLVTVNVKGNFFQVDLNAQLYEELRIIRKRFESIMGVESVVNEPKYEASFVERIVIHTPQPIRNVNKREVVYEDDLRAGAFQFVETSSATELPLPYQIQIYSNNEKSIICWRYPQPRCLTQVKIFPIPVQFERQTIFECDLEYYCVTTEQFKLSRRFTIHEDSLVLELPSRVLCSSIWRVTLVQTVIHTEDDDDDEDEITTLEEALSTDFHQAKGTTQFSPQLFVGCMRIDSLYNPEMIANAEILIQIAHVQVNLMAGLSGGRLPKFLESYTFVGDLIPAHPCVSLNLDKISIHASVFQNFDRINVDAAATIGLDIIDYSAFKYQPMVESFRAKAYVEMISDTALYEAESGSLKVNFITSGIHLHYGQATSHALAVVKRIFEEQSVVMKQHEHEFILLTKYIICNNTSADLQFGQAGNAEPELIPLPRNSFCLYALRNDHLERKICVMLDDMRSPTIHIDETGVRQILCVDQILVVRVEAISSFQKQVTFTGQAHFYNMTGNIFDVQYKVYTNSVDTTANSVVDEIALGEYGNASAIGKCNEGAHESMRIKLATHVKRGWSGEIPLKEIIPNGKPWLVKVPATNKFNEMCFWVRIIREDIEELRTSRLSCPQRVLVIIWPLFMLKSNLTVHTTAYEAEYDQNYSIFGRGKKKEMQMFGTSENEHELSFKFDFKSLRDEDKRNALLSYKLVDKRQFFQIPSKYANIEAAIAELQASEPDTWPCTREEELRCYRENSFQEATLPIYQCGPSHELSCALMMTISPWMLFINSTSLLIRLRGRHSTESCLVEPNNVVMPFAVESAFILDVKIDDWVTVGVLQLNQEQRELNAYAVPDEGAVQVSVKINQKVASFLVHSLTEDSMRVLTLCAAHVITNYSPYDLNYFAFAIQANEKATELSFVENRECGEIFKVKEESAKGSPMTLFSSLSSEKTKYKFGTTFHYFACIYGEDPTAPASCPLNLNRPCNRKAFSVWIGNRFVPITASIVHHHDQLFISLFDDNCPALSILNLTDFQFHVAQAATSNPSKTAVANSDSGPEDRFAWHQIIPSHQTVFYTPPIIDDAYPEIHTTTDFGLTFACVGSNPRWSRPVRITDENKDLFLEVPLYGDVKVSVNANGKTTEVVLDYIRQDCEFSAKDIRNRLSYPLLAGAASKDIVVERRQELMMMNVKQTRKGFQPIIHALMEGLKISLHTDCDKLNYERHGMLMLDFVQLSVQICSPTRQIMVAFNSFTAENRLFTTGEYDFPVIVCPQVEITEDLRSATVHELDAWFKMPRDPFCSFKVDLYEKESGCKNVEVKVKSIRAFIEDTYITVLVEYLNDCFGCSALYDVEQEVDKEKLECGQVLVPMIVQQQALLLSEPIRIRNISISGFHALISVHTCLRMYIALDQSPLDFSAYDKRNLFTLPEKLIANSLTMHYLSGVIFGVGWICGSLEILGSPSGLARSVSTGVRDFISMPVQGLFRGPWGFLVGVTNGSASLVKNVTAGTVNSVTKLAASVARNLDRLTLDSEHLQRTDAIRRSHPQSVTDGFTQGLTGLGISLLGALGGLAHHPLQASSPVGVMTGIGKGIVGAVTKPISGAAELLALTGQGVLQTVGFNSIPTSKTLATRETELGNGHKNIIHLMSGAEKAETILFCKFATLKQVNAVKEVLVCILPRDLMIFDSTYHKLHSFNLYKFKVELDVEDPTLVTVTAEEESQMWNEDSYHVSPRTLQYVQQSLSMTNLTGTFSQSDAAEHQMSTEEQVQPVEEAEQVAFWMDEGFAKHLVDYCQLQQRYIQLYMHEFSPYE